MTLMQQNTVVPFRPAELGNLPYSALKSAHRDLLGLLIMDGPLTDEQMQESLGWSGDYQRPRRVELEDAGYIERTHERRRTKAGRTAMVFQACVRAGRR